MKLSGNRLIESIVTQGAKHMVDSIKGDIPFQPFEKFPKESVFALITTAGVHLKSQEVFDVKSGDTSVRFIPADTNQEDLMISHTHFDRTDADEDINCVFPLFRLSELADEGLIGGVAATHYGLMGYIPDPKLLIEETIPAMIKQLKMDGTDVVILNPGWYICHQSVGLIQYALEKEGIPTISISHLVDLTEKVRVPRALHLRFPLGRSFGRAGEVDMQKQILLDCIHYLQEIKKPETVIRLPHKWKGRKK